MIRLCNKEPSGWRMAEPGIHGNVQMFKGETDAMTRRLTTSMATMRVFNK